MGTEPVSEDELSRAKKYLTGSFPLRLDTQGKLAGFLTAVDYFGLGLDYPSAIHLSSTPLPGRGAPGGKIYLHPEKAILVVVANLKEAGSKQGRRRSDGPAPSAGSSVMSLKCLPLPERE